MILRALTEGGIREFTKWIEDGPRGRAPVWRLEDKGLSKGWCRPFSPSVTVDRVPPFANRYDMGVYLVQRLARVPDGILEREQGVWAALSLLWFDALCPKAPGGKRKPGEAYWWVPSSDWKHAHRHAVRPCWELVRRLGGEARLLLLPSSPWRDSLKWRGEVFEQLASRRGVFANSPTRALALQTFADPETGRPLRGAAGRGPGSVRRMGKLCAQLDLTYDLGSMSARRIARLLPPEFDRWTRSGQGRDDGDS